MSGGPPLISLFHAGAGAHRATSRRSADVLPRRGLQESFPDDAVEDAFAEVFAFDWHDGKLRETLAGVLKDCGFETEATKPQRHGDAKKRLPKAGSRKSAQDSVLL